jgi:hypothetical protein
VPLEQLDVTLDFPAAHSSRFAQRHVSRGTVEIKLASTACVLHPLLFRPPWWGAAAQWGRLVFGVTARAPGAEVTQQHMRVGTPITDPLKLGAFFAGCHGDPKLATSLHTSTHILRHARHTNQHSPSGVARTSEK